MNGKRNVFPSKRDPWLTAVLLLAALVSASAALPPAPTWLSGLLVATAVVLAWIWLGTRYTVTSSELIINSGPFRWKVPLASIREVTPSRLALSSPALSLDRLLIRYGHGGFVLVSPADRQGFLKAIRAAGPGAAPSDYHQGDRCGR